MYENMKRDLVRALFKEEFSRYEIEGMYAYKGRVIAGYYIDRTVRLIDFLERLKDRYGILGHEAARFIIEEFNLEEYKPDTE